MYEFSPPASDEIGWLESPNPERAVQRPALPPGYVYIGSTVRYVGLPNDRLGINTQNIPGTAEQTLTHNTTTASYDATVGQQENGNMGSAETQQSMRGQAEVTMDPTFKKYLPLILVFALLVFILFKK